MGFVPPMAQRMILFLSVMPPIRSGVKSASYLVFIRTPEILVSWYLIYHRLTGRATDRNEKQSLPAFLEKTKGTNYNQTQERRL